MEEIKHFDAGHYELMKVFGIEVPEYQYLNIIFVKCGEKHPWNYRGYFVKFRIPIYIFKGFRVCPLYPMYMVDQNGFVFRISDFKRIHIDHSTEYPVVTVCKSPRSKSKRAALHRVIASAWVENDDPKNKTIINHKDGDKHNYAISNLEWVTYSENAFHAFRTGLRSDVLSVKIRDITNGEVTEYYSLEEMARALGMLRGRDPTYYIKRPTDVLLYKKYEVRVQGDERPWHYKVGDSPVPKSRYITTVTYPDGSQKVFWDNRVIVKEFKCWNVSSNIYDVVEKAKRLNPELKFEIEDRWKDRIVQTLRVEDMTVVDESEWVRNAAKYMQVTRGTVERLLRKNEHRTINGYAVRYKCDEPWNVLPEEFVGQPVRVRVSDTRDNSFRDFDSLRQIERDLNISRFISKRCLKAKAIYKHYLFTYVT